ncbi:ADAMTS-like protein 3 isoform X2 [Brienomyrus brachyistius]|uniref:ADAMTS-like protein 3 isoform X2 n=1 Tax=Brienomyrus brachyistius TaxID=42636 RepID=UPI0020B35291|nr:ADAMTS-like protein 3 isoform X2 [Brienomyrus brachyistius]
MRPGRRNPRSAVVMKIALLIWELSLAIIIIISSRAQMCAGQLENAYFLPEFALSPQGSILEDTTGEELVTYRYDDQASRMTRSDEDGDGGWDAWGGWSECSRTCGGGASYSLRRCLNGESCDGRSIRYRTCSNTDCPAESGDFRAQQCSAHNDLKYQGHTYEWVPVTDHPHAPCALRCQARGTALVVELAPKVLDGTRCRESSLDMCLSGVCQEVGCDRQLWSGAKEDGCGLCGGDGSTCRLVSGQASLHVTAEEPLKTVVEVPLGSRGVGITAKGAGLVIIESHSLSGHRELRSFDSPGLYTIENTAVDFQRDADKQMIMAHGPLMVKSTAPSDLLVHFTFYQPIRYQWRETGFFPCSVTCGGGYQLNSAECMDIRHNHTVPEQHCRGHLEARKPKAKLQECNMDACPESDGFKEVMPYDHFQPLPRWEHSPWTVCSVSCGGGTQERGVACVEEDVHGQATQAEEWKCMYSPRLAVQQHCNVFDCPQWTALDWSQCTVTCGRGLRYRVVLCIDHRGQHAGGCSAGLKPPVKEDCLVPVACYKPQEQLPVEAKLPWVKEAQDLEEPRSAWEEPMFIPGPWQPCSATCGPGLQQRAVQCRILLAFSQAEADLPDEECPEERPVSQRACHLRLCSGVLSPRWPPHTLYEWQYVGFAGCSSSCATGMQEAIVRCVDRGQGEPADDSFCDASTRPPGTPRSCNLGPCPPGWEPKPWTPCTATCGAGIRSRVVLCSRLVSLTPRVTVTVADEECVESKLPVLQSCNQRDCPPSWHVGEWQECSHTCGGGTRSRKVHCKQLLHDGGVRKLADTSCTGTKAAVRETCGRTDCPAQLAGAEWSPCSVSCGIGIQTREPVCRRRTAAGQQVTLGQAACSGLQAPPLVRTCRVSTCVGQQGEQKPKPSQKRDPYILALHRIYIQTQQEKRVHFTVGGRAYLLPRTSVVIRCPVRHFQKALIRWEKDGRALPSSLRVAVTKSGSLKIHSLEAGDIGVYRCVAGPAVETFVLKLIGNRNRLLETGVEADPQGEQLEEKWNQTNMKWQVGNRKNEFYLDDDHSQERTFLQVLGRSLSSSTASGRPVQDKVLQGAYSLEPEQFEELVRSLGQLVGHGDVTEGQVSQLVRELAPQKPRPRFELGEDGTTNTKASGKNSTEGASEGSTGRREKPVIVRQKQQLEVTFEKTVNISVGGSMFLTNTTQSVSLSCAVQGEPKPSVFWIKDGAPVQPSERVSWDSAGVLHISKPGVGDAGEYSCTVTNELGSDTATSRLLFAEPPTIRITSRDMSDLWAIVGGQLSARRGANITLECPVTGVPQLSVTWSKDGGDLPPNAVPLRRGSLLLHNVSMENVGSYLCWVSSPLGRSVASSLLLMSGAAQGRAERPHRSQKRVLMASPEGTEAVVRRGDILRIGCPVLPNHTQVIRWTFQNRTLLVPHSPQHRRLAGGRVLEVNTLLAKSSGTYACHVPAGHQGASAWVRVHLEGLTWSPGEWTACSATCGSAGTRSWKVHCVGPRREEAPPSACQHLPRPERRPQPCNVQDCPPSWGATLWSGCSNPCGGGTRHRQVSCQQLSSFGTVTVLADSACSGTPRPPHVEGCHGHSCSGWFAGPWEQCSGRCLGPASAIQSRPVICKHHNGSTLSESHCDHRNRLASTRNCTSEQCNVQWRVGPWRACSAACGSGIQSRRVECIHRRTDRTLAEQRCGWRRRPITWRHCVITSCGGECVDSTHYCAAVKELSLCVMNLYQQRCCRSCQGKETLPMQ